MGMAEHRNTSREQARINDLMKLVPANVETAMDIGARDGFLSVKLAALLPKVIALDLEKPQIADPRIQCVKGDATALAFDDASIDLLLCAEVLEHLPGPALEKACAELGRVARSHLIIGVPYKQDIRHARTTCRRCGVRNPPWGHVNSFDEQRLQALFPDFKVADISFVGTAEKGTNALSAALYDFAGNPFGTYSQDEGCVACGSQLQGPATRSLPQRVASKAAYLIREALNAFVPAHPNWVHILFERREPVHAASPPLRAAGLF